MTKEDLINYRSIWKEPVITKIDNKNWTVASIRPPSSSSVVQFVLNVMEGKYFSLLKDIQPNW